MKPFVNLLFVLFYTISFSQSITKDLKQY